MLRLTVSIPTVHAPMLLSNLLGIAGLLGLAVSVGAVVGSWWWSVLVGSVSSIALAWVAQTHATAAAAAAAAAAGDGDGATTQQLRVAPEPRSA